MLEVINEYPFFLLSSILDIIVFGKFIKTKIKINKFNLTIILFFSIVNCLFSIYIQNISNFARIFFTNLDTIIMLKLIYKETFSKIIIGTLFTLIGYIVGELVYIIVFFPFSSSWENNYILNNTIINVVIDISYYLLFCIPPLLLLISNILKWVDKYKAINLIFKYLLMILTLSLIMYPLSFNTMNKNMLFILFAIIIAILVFIVGYFKEKSDNNRLTIKFTQLLDYVKDYEKEVVSKGKTQHEHKNQLGVIAGMIPNNNEELNDLRDYVNKQLGKAKKLDDNTWLEKITDLPFGGIKGLVYLKIKKALEQDVILHIEVDKKLSVKKKWSNVDQYLEDYSRILGVYLDNAIEASIESKDRQIIIQFIDNKDNIEFILSNTYNGRINFNDINKEKFSTKGKDRGYGLSLVKDIIDKNSLISQKREIDGKFYVQKLYIKK